MVRRICTKYKYEGEGSGMLCNEKFFFQLQSGGDHQWKLAFSGYHRIWNDNYDDKIFFYATHSRMIPYLSV